MTCLTCGATALYKSGKQGFCAKHYAAACAAAKAYAYGWPRASRLTGAQRPRYTQPSTSKEPHI